MNNETPIIHRTIPGINTVTLHGLLPANERGTDLQADVTCERRIEEFAKVSR